MLLDSNVLVSLATRGREDHDAIRAFVEARSGLYVSALTRVEFLGWAGATPFEAALREVLYHEFAELAVDPVLPMAATLRQARAGLKTADAIIAATAILYRLPLVTRNVRDFAWAEQIRVVDPLAP